MLSKLSAAHRWLKVGLYEARGVRKIGRQDSIALGFAWRAANIGGVRRHLECIEKYSSFPVSPYPSTFASEQLRNGAERNSYHDALGVELIDKHALFHSHVDPRFINISRLAQQQGKPWVHTYHALYFAEDWDNQLLPWQEKINECLLNEASQADCCLAVNSWLVDWLDRNHGIKTQLLPNGVDMEFCDAALGDRFIEENALIDFVLFVGSSSSVKNPLAFIEMTQRFPDRTFVMIGTGLTKALIESTFGVEIPLNLRPLGPLPHRQTLDAIAACRTLVMTSHREGLPTVLLEAMAMKKPCVVPDAPWFADAIQSEAHGLRYEPGNLDDLAEKIEIAIRQQPLDSARQRVEEKFAWPVVIKQLDEIYGKLLS